MTIQPLISVIVVACNSSRYIRETLDSVFSQEYDPIELIVADDASGDDTLLIAEEWLSVNRSRFAAAFIVKNDANTGISGNCNRAVKKAGGTWLKLIAADDVLLPGCLRDCAGQTAIHPGVSVIFSRMETIDAHGKVKGEYRYPEAFFGYTTRLQLQCILHRNCLPAPTAFIRMADLQEMGLFDEAYPMMEDLPLWVKLLVKGKEFRGMDRLTVQYRVHDSLIYPVIGKRNKRYQLTIEDFDHQVRVPLAKNLSPLLYATVKVDMWVDHIVQRPLLYRIFLPALWIWARFSPFTVPGSRTESFKPAHA